MSRLRAALASPGALAVAIVALALGPLLLAVEPVGGDPDLLYRPIKTELARALAQGRLPFWSDGFGLGVPLVAESHVAAFYPPNWLLYRLLDVPVAYRISMWLHHVCLVWVTYAYARRFDLQPWGAALAAIAFTLCGFTAAHAGHEPLYSAMPWLVLALLVTENLITSRRVPTMALLAMAWAAQLTLGHFQIAAWTGVLVILMGVWRTADVGDRRHLPLLVGALAGGIGIACVQLTLSWQEATRLGTTARPLRDLLYFGYPPSHLPELVFPRLFTHLAGDNDAYWALRGTNPTEACLYLGTLPLILVFVAMAQGIPRRLAPWAALVPLSLALATMPTWWPSGYALLTTLPVIGDFRAPGRYTLIASLGLALLAGRGLDGTLPRRAVSTGVALAVGCGTLMAAWTGPLIARSVPAPEGMDLAHVFVWSGTAWVVASSAVLAWRAGWASPAVLLLVTGVELTALYYQGSTRWARAVHLPDESPVLTRLAREPSGGSVAGAVGNVPVFAGHAAAYPLLGMTPAPPTRWLGALRLPGVLDDPPAMRLLRRVGVNYAIVRTDAAPAGADVLYAGRDAALDRVAPLEPASGAAPDRWQLLRFERMPSVHVATRTAIVPDLARLASALWQADTTDTAWFLPGDAPPTGTHPRATAARVVTWRGLGGEVEHDGTCDVVIRRAHAPGWSVRVDDGPPIPVSRVDGGLQAVRLFGAGRSRLALQYEPPSLRLALLVSLSTLGLMGLLVFRRPSPASPPHRRSRARRRT